MIQMQTESAASILPFVAAEYGQLTVYVSETAIHEVAFRTAADLVSNGEKLIVVDAAGCFHPLRMTQSARIGALDPAGLLKHLHILDASSPKALEQTILHDLESAFDRFGTRRVLIADPLDSLYDSQLSTRDAAQTLGRVKLKLEALANGGAHIVVLCYRRERDMRTRSHFVLSLCAAADRVYFRNRT
jgi:hypothetical protein